MAKINVTVRLDSGLVGAADRYAGERRGWNRTTVVEAALEGFLEDVKGGVPDRPAAVPDFAPKVDWNARVTAQRERDKGR